MYYMFVKNCIGNMVGINLTIKSRQEVEYLLNAMGKYQVIAYKEVE